MHHVNFVSIYSCCFLGIIMMHDSPAFKYTFTFRKINFLPCIVWQDTNKYCAYYMELFEGCHVYLGKA